MSDLKSELVSKVLNQWENVAVHTSNQSIKSFGERVYDYIHANPYCTITEIKLALDAKDSQSTASQLKTLVDRGMVGRVEKPMVNYPGFGRRTQYNYYALTDVYETVNKGYSKPKKKMGRPLGSHNKPKEVAPVDIETPAIAPILEKKLHKLQFNPEMFVQELTLKDAKAVYEVLKGYFG